MQNTSQNLYEIPSCTICLAQLCQDLSNLNCGHVFHLNCISQHFEYRQSCPNCQKRSMSKEIRMVVFPMTKNTQSASLMRQLLGNLSTDEKQQIQTLFKQYQVSIQKNEKYEKQLIEFEKQLKKATSQCNQTKTSHNKVKIQLQTLKKDSLQLNKCIESLHNSKKSLQDQNFKHLVTIEDYKQKQSEYDKIKKLKKIMANNSADVIAYRNQLLSQKKSPEDMSKQFLDMVLMRNLQISKLKEINRLHPQKIHEKQVEIQKLRSQIEKQKRQMRDIQEKRSAEKRKYEELKAKYRTVIQKYKAKCQQALSEQQNYEDSISRSSFPLLNGIQAVNKQCSLSGQLNGNKSYSNNIKEQNVDSNIQIEEAKYEKRTKANMFDNMMIEEQSSNNVSRNNMPQKKTVQQSLSSFVSQKPSFGSSFGSSFNSSIGSFGGVAPRKKAQDKKAPMKNIFG